MVGSNTKNTNKIKRKTLSTKYSIQIPTEDPLLTEEDDEEEKETTEEKTPSDSDPQLVEEKMSSGCSLCNIL